MHKIEVFLPLPGMTAAMDEYFASQNVIRLDGLPTGPEIYAENLPEEELLRLGLEAAQSKVDRLSQLSGRAPIVSAETPFIDEFRDEDGRQIGWEFEFQVYEDLWDGED